MNADPLADFPSERLPREQENALALQGNQDAWNTLAMHSMREAVLYSRKVFNGLLDDSTLISLCYEALMRAAKRFQPNRQRFFAFAKIAVRGHIRRYWGKLYPLHAEERRVYSDDNPDDEVLHPRPLASEDERIQYAPARVALFNVSLPEMEKIENKDGMAELLKYVSRYLTEQERMILSLVYKSGFNFPEIAKLLDISKSAAHATHAEALRKLRASSVNLKRLFTR